MTLHELLASQRAFQEIVIRYKYQWSIDTLTAAQKNAIFNDTVLGLVSETTEFLDEANWKMHQCDRDFVYERQLEEVVDIIKYALNLLVYLGVTDGEFAKMFYGKTVRNYEKFMLNFPRAVNDANVQAAYTSAMNHDAQS